MTRKRLAGLASIHPSPKGNTPHEHTSRRPCGGPEAKSKQSHGTVRFRGRFCNAFRPGTRFPRNMWTNERHRFPPRMFARVFQNATDFEARRESGKEKKGWCLRFVVRCPASPRNNKKGNGTPTDAVSN